MTSGPGITDKTDSPDDAIEEISGLLEMDELKASEASAEESEQASAVSDAVGEALDVAMETPSPVKPEADLPPPPVSDEPIKEEAAEGEAGMGSNMAYEDLLERLVLPAQPASVEEAPAHQVTPRPIETHASSPTESLFPSDLTPGPALSDERTVVTVNPLLAEEQEAAARGAENYFLPVAAPPQPLLPNTPVVVPLAPPAKPKSAALPGKVIQFSYPIFGGIVLGGIILGVLVGRVSAPTKVIEKIVQVQPVSAPATPPPSAQAANPSPEVVPLPTPTEAPKPAAQPAAAAEPAQPEAVAAKAEAEEAPAEEAKPKPKAHHAAKVSHSAKAAAKPAAAVKPAAAAKPTAAAKPAPAPAPAAKPAAGKKPAKGWVDPFAN